MASGDVYQWQQAVDQFGGRQGAPDSEALWRAIQASNLGSTKFLDTVADPPIFEPVITLAQMDLPVPIPVDVSFAYLNRFPQAGGAFPDSGLNVGDGFVRITWGVPGGVKNVAEVDGAYGWRFPFVASFLRVEYVANGQQSGMANPEWALLGGQVRNLGVSAMIAPASGAPCLPLTKTVFMPFVDGVIFAVFGLVPRWSKNFMVGGDSNGGSYRLVFAEGGPAIAGPFLQEIFVDGLAGGWPEWTMKKIPVAVPQGAAFVFLFPDPGTELDRYTVIFELAL